MECEEDDFQVKILEGSVVGSCIPNFSSAEWNEYKEEEKENEHGENVLNLKKSKKTANAAKKIIREVISKILANKNLKKGIVGSEKPSILDELAVLYKNTLEEIKGRNKNFIMCDLLKTLVLEKKLNYLFLQRFSDYSILSIYNSRGEGCVESWQFNKNEEEYLKSIDHEEIPDILFNYKYHCDVLLYSNCAILKIEQYTAANTVFFSNFVLLKPTNYTVYTLLEEIEDCARTGRQLEEFPNKSDLHLNASAWIEEFKNAIGTKSSIEQYVNKSKIKSEFYSEVSGPSYSGANAIPIMELVNNFHVHKTPIKSKSLNFERVLNNNIEVNQPHEDKQFSSLLSAHKLEKFLSLENPPSFSMKNEKRDFKSHLVFRNIPLNLQTIFSVQFVEVFTFNTKRIEDENECSSDLTDPQYNLIILNKDGLYYIHWMKHNTRLTPTKQCPPVNILNTFYVGNRKRLDTYIFNFAEMISEKFGKQIKVERQYNLDVNYKYEITRSEKENFSLVGKYMIDEFFDDESVLALKSEQEMLFKFETESPNSDVEAASPNSDVEAASPNSDVEAADEVLSLIYDDDISDVNEDLLSAKNNEIVTLDKSPEPEIHISDDDKDMDTNYPSKNEAIPQTTEFNNEIVTLDKSPEPEIHDIADDDICMDTNYPSKNEAIPQTTEFNTLPEPFGKAMNSGVEDISSDESMEEYNISTSPTSSNISKNKTPVPFNTGFTDALEDVSSDECTINTVQASAKISENNTQFKISDKFPEPELIDISDDNSVPISSVNENQTSSQIPETNTQFGISHTYPQPEILHNPAHNISMQMDNVDKNQTSPQIPEIHTQPMSFDMSDTSAAEPISSDDKSNVQPVITNVSSVIEENNFFTANENSPMPVYEDISSGDEDAMTEEIPKTYKIPETTTNPVICDVYSTPASEHIVSSDDNVYKNIIPDMMDQESMDSNLVFSEPIPYSSILHSEVPYKGRTKSEPFIYASSVVKSESGKTIFEAHEFELEESTPQIQLTKSNSEKEKIEAYPALHEEFFFDPENAVDNLDLHFDYICSNTEIDSLSKHLNFICDMFKPRSIRRGSTMPGPKPQFPV